MAKYTIITKEQEFVPEWDGNRDRDDDDQVKFVLRFLTDAQRARCTKVTHDEQGEPNITFDYEYAIRHGVISISGLEVNGNEIKTPRDFLGLSGFSALLYEVGAEVISMNAREDTGPLS